METNMPSVCTGKLMSDLPSANRPYSFTMAYTKPKINPVQPRSWSCFLWLRLLRGATKIYMLGCFYGICSRLQSATHRQKQSYLQAPSNQPSQPLPAQRHITNRWLTPSWPYGGWQPTAGANKSSMELAGLWNVHGDQPDYNHHGQGRG